MLEMKALMKLLEKDIIFIHKVKGLFSNRALDSTSVRICLEPSPWAEFHYSEGYVKMYTLMDLRGSIPSCIIITNGLVHD